MQKKEVTLSPGESFDQDTLEVGEKAIITLEDGRKLQTSPVEDIGIDGNGMMKVETRHTVYHSQPVRMAERNAGKQEEEILQKKEETLPPGTFIDIGSLKVGERAKFILPDGKILQTSPVVSYEVHGGMAMVETGHTVYYNQPGRTAEKGYVGDPMEYTRPDAVKEMTEELSRRNEQLSPDIQKASREMQAIGRESCTGDVR